VNNTTRFFWEDHKADQNSYPVVEYSFHGYDSIQSIWKMLTLRLMDSLAVDDPYEALGRIAGIDMTIEDEYVEIAESTWDQSTVVRYTHPLGFQVEAAVRIK
jgi:hypothetical protein